MAGNRAIDYRELRREVELNGSTQTTNRLTRLLEEQKVKPNDFSIRELAEAYLGREWVMNLHPKYGRLYDRRALLEAGGDATAVAYGDFSNITGQVFFNAVKEPMQVEANFPFSAVVPTKPSDIQDMEKIPGIAEVGDEFSVIGEAEEYPNFGVSEDYVEIAAKQKRGGIVPVTREAIFGDRTGVLLDRCRRLGFWLAYNKEKRIIDCVIDENAGAATAATGGHRYHWKGTSIATYADNSGTHDWDNLQASNALVDWTDIENALVTLSLINDPYTAEPIMQAPTHIIVTPTNAMTAWYVLRATEARTHAGGYAVTGNLRETASGNPLQGWISALNLQILTSQLLAARAATDTDWWLGSPGKAFGYFANWDVETEEAPPNSREAFARDIVFQFKASEKGTAGTLEPRVMIESNA